MKTHTVEKAIIAVALLAVLVMTGTASGLTVGKRTRDAQPFLKYAHYTFENYVRDYGKQYHSQAEHELRKRIFEQNLAKINAHNHAGTSSYVMGVNHMTDWTDVEFSRLNAARPLMRKHASVQLHQKQFVPQPNVTLPSQVDYRNAIPTVLTAVKNQGHCGSCWAHSAVEAIESHVAIRTGKLYVLSQQQLTSCTPNPNHCGGTGGCFGSIESLAFDYVAEQGGLAEEWDYPYTSYHGDSGICRGKDDFGSVYVGMDGYASIEKNNQRALMEAVATVGPIAVSVDASRWSSYESGIFDRCGDYSEKNITQNHAVQLVGYGRDPSFGKDYWIIRNSWGPGWGENGYMRLSRQSIPACGWSEDAHSGAACDGDPDEEWVCGECGILSGATYPTFSPDEESESLLRPLH